MNWIIIGSIVLCIMVIVISIMLICSYRKQTEEAMQKILDKLDMALTGNVIEIEYDESMDSAIAERLNRVIGIAEMQRDAAREERDCIKSLISDISHQVRNPLSNIMLFSGLLLEQKLDETSKILTEKIQGQSGKLDFFMKAMVKFSIAEQGMIVVSPALISVSELIYLACQSVEVAALKKNINIRCEVIDSKCFADKEWTIEAISNVLENAVKYSPEESEIVVGVKEYDSFMCVEICDSGMGIPEAEQGLIFQRFYRSKEVKDISGFGIGLYLVREVLSKEGGYVKVQSRPLEGSRFQLFLTRNQM